MRILIRQGEGPDNAYARAAAERHADMQAINRITDTALDTPADTRKYYSTIGDEARLRGIPAVGRGVGGAIPGTKPGQRH